MNRRDRVSVWLAAGVAAVGLIGGTVSGAWGLTPPSEQVTATATADTTAVYVHDCADYTDGATVTGDIPGACLLPTEHNGFPNLDTTNYGTDIPRCAEDDWNADGVPRCYTERVDGAVILLGSDDNVIATLAG